MAEIKIIDHTTTTGAPDVNYKLYGTLIERTATTAKIKFKIVTKLLGSSPVLGYGLKATISSSNSSDKTVTIKDGSSWKGTSSHTVKDINVSFSGLTANTSSIAIKFRVVRTDGGGAGHMSSAVSKTFHIGTTSSSTSSTIITNADNTNYCPYIETYSDPVIGSQYPIQLYRPLSHKASIDLKIGETTVTTWNDLYRVIEILDFGTDTIKNIFSSQNNTQATLDGVLKCFALDKASGKRIIPENGFTEAECKNFTPTEYKIQLAVGEYLARPVAPIIRDNIDDATDFSENVREFKIEMPGSVNDFKFGAVQNKTDKWKIQLSHDSSYVSYSWDSDQRILKVTQEKESLDDIVIQIRAIDSRGIVGQPTNKLCFPGKAGILYRDEDRWQGVSF